MQTYSDEIFTVEFEIKKDLLDDETKEQIKQAINGSRDDIDARQRLGVVINQMVRKVPLNNIVLSISDKINKKFESEVDVYIKELYARKLANNG